MNKLFTILFTLLILNISGLTNEETLDTVIQNPEVPQTINQEENQISVDTQVQGATVNANTVEVSDESLEEEVTNQAQNNTEVSSTKTTSMLNGEIQSNESEELVLADKKNSKLLTSEEEDNNGQIEITNLPDNQQVIEEPLTNAKVQVDSNRKQSHSLPLESIQNIFSGKANKKYATVPNHVNENHQQSESENYTSVVGASLFILGLFL
jgi:hypothetical protein